MEIRTKIEHTSKYFTRILKHRHKEKNKHVGRKTIVIYDLDVVDIIIEWARLNDTNLSAVISNLLDELLKQIDSPQKTIESFEVKRDMPALDAKPEEWRAFLNSINTIEEYKSKIDKPLMSVLQLCNQKNMEFNQY